MKLDDIRKTLTDDPKALFATCDWAMVRPVTPVADKWTTESDAATGKTKYVVAEDTDPWAKCGPAKKPQTRGVLVEVFNFDAEGKQRESLGQMLVRARDIGGSWGEFLTLHAEEVRKRGEKYEAEKQRREAAVSLGERARAIGLSWPIGKVEGRDRGDRGFYSMGLGSDVSVSAPEYYNYDTHVERFKEIKPAGFELKRWHPKLSVSAGNAADVEYLFQVLEAGVKVIEKKRARAAAKTQS